MAQTNHQDATTFGELLRYLRRRMQMTQEQLGIAVGYSAALIGRLENNERLPDVGMVKTAYVEALGLEHEPELATRLVKLAVAASLASAGDAARGADCLTGSISPTDSFRLTSRTPGSCANSET